MIISFSFLSLLDKDYKKGIIEFSKLAQTGWIHYDVMDGKFVSNKTFDSSLIKEVLPISKLFNDVHLMVDDIDNNIDEYLVDGVNQITFHYEAISKDKIPSLIKKIKKHNIKVGISIKPMTDITVLDEYLDLLDYILVMSVEPGKGGQEFMDNSLDKIRYLKAKQNKYHYLIAVDGGINDRTIKLVKDAGADVSIVGTYLASNINKETLNKLK